MNKKLEAVFDNILVKPLDSTEQTYGNIIVPDMGDSTSIIGTVISVGPGKVNFGGIFVPTTIKVGDIVHLPPMGPIKVNFEKEAYWVAPESQTLIIIKEHE